VLSKPSVAWVPGFPRGGAALWTIEGYIGNIFSKLGFSSRAQIAAWAVEKGLLQPGPPQAL